MFASALTAPASPSDPSTLAGMLVVLSLLGVAALWAWLTPDRHPDVASMARHGRMTEGLARSVASHPANTPSRPACRFCGVPVNPFAPGGEVDLCQSLECFDKAINQLDENGFGR